MAIKFVDIEPGDEKPKTAAAPKTKPATVDTSDASARRPSDDLPDDAPALPGIAYGKPAPKRRGRK